jgi:hypothetical protein
VSEEEPWRVRRLEIETMHAGHGKTMFEMVSNQPFQHFVEFLVS